MELIDNSKENGLKHLVPNYNLWCGTYNCLETDNFVELNGVLYWTDEKYSKIIGKVNMKKHNKVEL